MLEAIDALVAAEIEGQGPGVAVAVVKDGDVLHSTTYGYANLEWGCPITPDTVFCLASVTKPFTELAVLLLEEQGRLSIEEPVTTYLPEYQAIWQDITLAHLLTHTSGIKNYVALDHFWKELSRADRSPEELLALVQHLPLEFAPGSRYSYSNSGYCLLGRVIEAVSGMSYEAFLQSHIFQPLGMLHSRYMAHEPIIPQRASGYEKADHGSIHVPYMSMTLPYAAGSLGSTLEDLICWDRALREQRLVSTERYERMYAPVRLTSGRTENYGYGWAFTRYRGHKVAHHAGGVPGFSSFIGRFLDDDMALIILSNLDGFNAGKLARKIADLVLKIPGPGREPVFLDAAAQRKVVGVYADEGSGVVLEEWKIKIAREGDRLTLRGHGFSDDLIPTSESTFYLEHDEEVELRFEDEREDGFHRVTVSYPFYWFGAVRKQD